MTKSYTSDWESHCANIVVGNDFVVCHACRGTGKNPNNPEYSCYVCGGSGYIHEDN